MAIPNNPSLSTYRAVVKFASFFGPFSLKFHELLGIAISEQFGSHREYVPLGQNLLRQNRVVLLEPLAGFGQVLTSCVAQSASVLGSLSPYPLNHSYRKAS